MMAVAGALWLVTMAASLGASTPTPLPLCGTQEESPELTAFEQLQPGSAFHVEVKWDAKAGWIPAKPIAMPMHHASRIEWTNVQAWPVLAKSRAIKLRFLAWLLVEDLEKVPGQHRWRATYQARIDGLCRMPKATTEDEATVSVYVVDEAGNPITGASVTGKVTANPGPLPSTCCSETDFGQAVTDRKGRAALPSPPFTFRPMHVTARRAGWPEREVVPQFKMEEGELRATIVLGPARTVAGTVEVGPGCPSRFLRVETGQPGQTALVDAKGHFVLHGISPWTSLQVVACGRYASIKLDEHPRDEPILLELATPTKQTRNYVTPTVADALPWPLPSRVAPAGARPCVPPGRGLIAAGDFDWVTWDDGCRAYLAYKNIDGGASRAFTLVRADGGAVVIGATWNGRDPVVGKDLVVAERAPGRIEALAISGDGRTLLDGVQRFALGAEDALVLASTTARVGALEAVDLDVLFSDGQRQRVAGSASPSWMVFPKAGGRWLVYAKRGDDGLEMRAFDLVGRTDRRLVSRSDTWPLRTVGDDDPRLLLTSAGRLALVDPQTGTSTVVGPAADWRHMEGEVFLRTGLGATPAVWTPAGERLLRFEWPAMVQVYPKRITDHYLLFHHERDAVLINTQTGEARLLAAEVIPTVLPIVARDRVAVEETSFRTLVVSLAGEPLRAVGRGEPKSFSADGRWLAIEPPLHELPQHVTLASLDDPAKNMTFRAVGGSWAPNAPIFYIRAESQTDEPSPLFAVLPEQGRMVTVEPRVRSHRVLPDGDLLVVVPAGSHRAAGIWRLPGVATQR